MLDGFVVGRRPDAKRAGLVDRHAAVEGDSKAADARIDRQTRSATRRQELDFGVEGPATSAATRTPMQGGIGATLGQDRGKSIDRDCQSMAKIPERLIVD